MRIAVDLTNYVEGRAIGYNTYALNLLGGISSLGYSDRIKYTFFVRSDHILFFQNKFSGLNFKPVKISNAVFKIIWQNFGLSLISNFDIYLFTANFAPYFFGKKYVLVIHDLNFIKFPENFGFFSRLYRILFIKKSILAAAEVIAISNVVANEVFHYSGRNSTVIYNPVPINVKNFNESKKTASSLKILIPSSIGFHKNIINAYLACQKIIENNKNIEVKFIGNWDKSEFPINKGIDCIKTIGFIDLNAKLLAFNEADIILYPSIYEGFGLPYIEAISHEKLLVCSKIPIAMEIAGKYPIYIDPPFGEEQIVNALLQAILISKTCRAFTVTHILKKFDPKKIARNYQGVLLNA